MRIPVILSGMVPSTRLLDIRWRLNLRHADLLSMRTTWGRISPVLNKHRRQQKLAQNFLNICSKYDKYSCTIRNCISCERIYFYWHPWINFWIQTSFSAKNCHSQGPLKTHILRIQYKNNHFIFVYTDRKDFQYSFIHYYLRLFINLRCICKITIL